MVTAGGGGTKRFVSALMEAWGGGLVRLAKGGDLYSMLNLRVGASLLI